MATARWLVATARWFCGRQVLLRLRGYISVCPTLQLSHNDVPGVGLGGCWNQVLPSHSQEVEGGGRKEEKVEKGYPLLPLPLPFSPLSLSLSLTHSNFLLLRFLCPPTHNSFFMC